MMQNLWKKCINCKDVPCCKEKKIFYKLFLTKQEKNNFPEINKTYPCKFLNSKSLCEIHDQRPIDCRLFPFDIAKIDNKFYWIYWKTNCSVIKKGTKKELEICLKDIEKNILPKFKKHIEAYSQFRYDELLDTFGKYVIIRELHYK
jgi:Fe-S-cluster containining protein